MQKTPLDVKSPLASHVPLGIQSALTILQYSSYTDEFAKCCYLYFNDRRRRLVSWNSDLRNDAHSALKVWTGQFADCERILILTLHRSPLVIGPSRSVSAVSINERREFPKSELRPFLITTDRTSTSDISSTGLQEINARKLVVPVINYYLPISCLYSYTYIYNGRVECWNGR